MTGTKKVQISEENGIVQIECALAVCTWNDSCSSLHGLVQRLELQSTLSS